MLSNIWQKVKTEPARVLMIAMAIIALGAQFGIHLSDPQLEALKNVVGLLLAFFGAGEGTRALVTPNATAEKAVANAATAAAKDGVL